MPTSFNITTRTLKLPVPTLVYHMHVPETGGREISSLLDLWLNKVTPNCLVEPCCLPWKDYISRVHAAFAENISCVAISQEIHVIGMYQTQRVTRQLNKWWYKVSLFRNPLQRFVSVVRHAIQKGQCLNMDFQRAVDSKLDGQCGFGGYDQEQASYYLDNASHFNFSFVPNATKTLSVLDDNDNLWPRYLLNFDYIGITDYMDASICVMSLELVNVRLLNTSYALHEACFRNSTVQRQMHREDESSSNPLTTKQIIKILTLWAPLDAQLYPRVLNLFRRKLRRAFQVHPSLKNKFQANLTLLNREVKVWKKVVQMLQKYVVDQEQSALYQGLEELTKNEKEMLAPGLRWSKM